MPVIPAGFGKLIPVQRDGIISVQITEIPDLQITGDAPGLAFVITDVLDLQANFLHDLPGNTFLGGLTDLNEAGKQRKAGIISACVFTQNQTVSVNERYDYRGGNPGEDHVAAMGAAHHALFGIMFRLCAAAAAELIVPVPGEQVPAGHGGEADILADGLP